MTNSTAGIIIIGDEILSGRTKDTNSNFIAKELINIGIELEQVRIIKDKKETIVSTVREFHNLYTYVFTTGGIGPTHDDVTSESLSIAFNEDYCFHDEAYKILENYYSKGEFNEGRQKMAKMPKSAELILNPLTGAPGFKIKNIFVLPGVPEILQKMFDNILVNIKRGKPKKIVSINTNLFESTIAKELSLIQNKNDDCSIGSYPYFDYIKKSGGVNIVISSWTLDNLEHVVNEIRNMISLLGGKSFIV